MADLNLGDGLRKIVLAGIGALATTYEKSSEIVDELVKKGEITVEQGKALNTELKRKVSEVVDDAKTPTRPLPRPMTNKASRPSERFHATAHRIRNGYGGS